MNGTIAWKKHRTSLRVNTPVSSYFAKTIKIEWVYNFTGRSRQSYCDYSAC